METSNSGSGNDMGEIICERVIEHEIIIPKRIVREEVIEKIFVVPETVVREEIIEEVQKIRERIIEIAKPVIKEKIVEVPQIEYREKLVERVEKVYEKKIKEVPKIEYRERIVEVPKYVDPQGNPIDPPEKEIRESVVERVIEVPQTQETVVIREVPVPKYIEKVIVPDPGVSIKIPVPIEAVTTYDYQLKHPTPVINEVDYPIYVPRFTEVLINAQLFEPQQLQEMAATQTRLHEIVNKTTPVSLPEVESFATEVRAQTFLHEQASPETFKNNIIEGWKNGQINMISRPQAI